MRGNRRGVSLDATAVPQLKSRHLRGFEHGADDGVRGHSVRNALVTQDNPMTQNFKRDGGEILAEDVTAAPYECQCSSRADQVDRRARAAPLVDRGLELGH